MDPEAPTVNIRGDKVAFGPFLPEHVPHVCRWYNDYAGMRGWGLPPGPYTAATVARAFEPGATFAAPGGVAFAVYDTDGWEMLGFAGLIHIDHVDRTGELFIMIGEQRLRGRGFGTEAARLVLDHAFLGIGLANVFLRVAAYNRAGIRAYEKAGFRRIGVRRNAKFMGGQLWDVVFMDAVAADFISPALSEILVPDPPRPA